MDCGTHFLECAATANVGDSGIDICIRGFGVLPQKSGGSHDHAVLAVAALWRLFVNPSFLDFAQLAAYRETLNRLDFSALNNADRQNTRTHSSTIEQNGTRATLRNAATVLGSRQTNLLTNNPKQGGAWVHVYGARSSIDGQLCHEDFLTFLSNWGEGRWFF
jgi:hypothetical protein